MLLIDTDIAGLTRLAMDIDDDLALLMAAKREQLVAVTVTWGNAPAALCYRAAQRLLRRLGRDDIPVFKGSECSVPLPYACPKPASSAASQAIARHATANPGRLTVLALGPLSNLAAALRDRPQLSDELERVIIVGGSRDRRAGLARILASNFYWLPDWWSTQVVLGSRLPKTLVTVETMGSAYLDAAWLRGLNSSCCPGAAVCEYVPALAARAEMRVMERLFPEWHVDSASWVPWDAVVMALFQRPALFEGWRLYTAEIGRIISLSPLAHGSTGMHSERDPFHVLVPTVVNRSGFAEHLAAALCAARSIDVAVATSSWPTAWQNLPVTLLNRGWQAFEPIGVPRSFVAITFFSPFVVGLCCRHYWQKRRR